MGEPFKLEPWAPSRFSKQGKELEKLIQRTQNRDFCLIRIPDAYQYGGSRARHRNPGDFVGHVKGHPLMVEAKETMEDSLPRAKLWRKESIHQYESMLRWVDSHRNNIAGYIVRTCHDFITWVPVQDVEAHTSYSPQLWGVGGINGLNLLKDPLDWGNLILGGKNGDTESKSVTRG